MVYGGSFDVKKDLKVDGLATDQVEDISASDHADQLAQLSSIETTAASKGAWLISITVSLGGLLFGMWTSSNQF